MSKAEVFKKRKENWANNSLYSLRRASGMTQSRLADKLKKSRAVVSAYENKRQHPTQTVIDKLCKILKVKQFELLSH